MESKSRILQSLFKKAFDYYGPRHWWPGESPFEVMVGAILTQNTAWANVEKAIINLKRENVLTPKRLYQISPTQLAQWIRPAGYFRVKTKRLRSFLKFFLEKYQGNVSKMKKVDLPILREELLAVHGIGPETADSILLYALEKPIFVVDAYTKRILNRHYLSTEDADYEELQEFFMDHLKPDAPFYNEYHALLVHLGKDFCRTRPQCDRCPLKGFHWPD